MENKPLYQSTNPGLPAPASMLDEDFRFKTRQDIHDIRNDVNGILMTLRNVAEDNKALNDLIRTTLNGPTGHPEQGMLIRQDRAERQINELTNKADTAMKGVWWLVGLFIAQILTLIGSLVFWKVTKP